MFDSSLLKIKRANKHIAEFNEALSEFVQSDFYAFHVEKDESIGQDVFRFKVIKDTPDDLPLILGDALHNLRAAIDIAFVELVNSIGKTADRNTMFRFGNDRAVLVETLNKGILKGEDDIISMIADRIQPYKGGNDLLHALHGLDIDDKHKLLIPTFSITQLKNVEIQIGGFNMKMGSLSFKGDGVANLVSGIGKAKPELKRCDAPVIHVLFGEETSLAGQPISSTLAALNERVAEVINEFEIAIKNRNTSPGNT